MTPYVVTGKEGLMSSEQVVYVVVTHIGPASTGEAQCKAFFDLGKYFHRRVGQKSSVPGTCGGT